MPGLVEGLLPRARAGQDREDLVDLGARHRAVRGLPAGVDLAQARDIGLRCVLQRPDQRQGLLPLPDVAGLRLSRLGRGPEAALHVVGHLEGEAQVVAEVAERLDRVRVVGGEDGAGLDGGAHQRGRLLPDHREVFLDRDVVATLEADVHELALAERQARLVVDAHEGEDPRLAEAVGKEPVQREP